MALLPHIFDPLAYISLYCLPFILSNVQQIVKITCRNNDKSHTAPFSFRTKVHRLQPCAALAEEKFQRRVQLNSPWLDHIAALQGVLNTKVIVFPQKRLEGRRKRFIIHSGPCSCLMLNVAREVPILINDCPARAKKLQFSIFSTWECFGHAHYFLCIFVGFFAVLWRVIAAQSHVRTAELHAHAFLGQPSVEPRALKTAAC